MAKGRLCEVEGCGKPHEGRGFCKNHLYKFDRYGDPLAGKVLTPKGEQLKFLLSLLSERRDECIYWPYQKRGPFGYAAIYYKGRTHTAHRLLCEILNGPPPTDKHEAAHNCGKGREGCVNPYHTRWATPKENMSDQIVHGTRRRGKDIHTTKLDPERVRAMRADLAAGATQVATAEKYGVSRRLVRSIIAGKYWKWVK